MSKFLALKFEFGLMAVIDPPKQVLRWNLLDQSWCELSATLGHSARRHDYADYDDSNVESNPYKDDDSACNDADWCEDLERYCDAPYWPCICTTCLEEKERDDSATDFLFRSNGVPLWPDGADADIGVYYNVRKPQYH